MDYAVYTPDEVSPACGLRGLCLSSKELYHSLGRKDNYSSWIAKKVSKLSLKEGKDFFVLKDTNTGGRPGLDYIVTLEAAKIISAADSSKEGIESLKNLVATETRQAEALTLLSHIEYEHPEGLVFSDNGVLYTTSLVLAKISGKTHANVLRDISRELEQISTASDLTSLEISQLQEGFREITYKDAKGEMRKCYNLSEEAFLQIALRYSASVRGKFVLAFVSYRNALTAIYKARLVSLIIPQDKAERGFVYVIQESESGNLKIGVSKDPLVRLKQLQTGNSQDLNLLYTSLVCSNAFEVESSVHKAFAEYAIRGEWFNSKLAPEDVISFLESQRFVLTSEFGLNFGSDIIKMIEAPGG